MTRYISTLVLLISVAASADTGTLSVDSYLAQVKKKHEGMQGAALVSEAEELRAPESGVSQAWTLSAGAEQRNDFRLPIGVSFQTKQTVYSLGVSKLTGFGLLGKISMNVTPLSFQNVSAQFASFLPFTSYYDVATTVELTQSLWKNGFGRTTRAQEDVDEALAMANHHRNEFTVIQIQSQAETTYWTAAGYQEILRIQKETLERSAKLVGWSKGRVNLDLADKADLLQAESALRLRELELAQSQGDFKTTCRQFNSYRGVSSDELSEKLLPVYIEDVDAMKPPERAKFRQDVLAAVQDAKVAYSNARLGAERNKPTLEAYASYSLSGRDGSLSNALNMMTGANYTFGIFGVRFATPLNFGTLYDDNEAYLKEQKAADLNMARKQFEQENDWSDLTRRLGESKEKLHLSRQLEKAQEEKYRYERDRLKNARTTLFQVLQFEQDYASAQLTRIQRETEVRNILTQMKTFGGKS